jgi:hypothetical protein
MAGRIVARLRLPIVLQQGPGEIARPSPHDPEVVERRGARRVGGPPGQASPPTASLPTKFGLGPIECGRPIFDNGQAIEFAIPG